MTAAVDRSKLTPAPEGEFCVASVRRDGTVCDRPARYLTDLYQVPVCGLHHPELMREAIERGYALNASLTVRRPIDVVAICRDQASIAANAKALAKKCREEPEL